MQRSWQFHHHAILKFEEVRFPARSSRKQYHDILEDCDQYFSIVKRSKKYLYILNSATVCFPIVNSTRRVCGRGAALVAISSRRHLEIRRGAML